MSESWRQVDCHHCGGYGVVSVYSYGPGGCDFEGPGECKVCGGTGNMWISPKGRIAEYPGGRFLGSLARESNA